MRIPKKSQTVVRKIRKENPWGIGDGFAAIIETNYQNLTEAIANQSKSHVRDIIYNLPYIKIFAQSNRLSPYHLADVLIREYFN